MTLGQIAIITPEGRIMTSTEFNGNMDYEGHGESVFGNLECVETIEDYKEFVTKFNDEKIFYDKELFYDMPQGFLNMRDDYFGKWFSD